MNVYRYGFNGKENDNEVKGEGSQQDYGMRVYDPRVGKFLSVDPLTKSYPELTPYQFASNTPIQAIDLDGAEAFFVHGTESSAKRWTESNMAKRGVQTLLRLTNNKYYNVGFNWGSIVYNDYGIRAEAAKQLATYVLRNRVKGEEITLIGHSHGGNVAIQAAKIIYEGTGIKVNIITIGTPAYNKKGGVENPETNKKYINDHIALWNTVDGVSGGMAGDDYFKTSSITTNVEIDVSKYFDSGETVDAHSFDVLAPESIENAIKAGKVRKLKPAALKANVEVMAPKGTTTNLTVKSEKNSKKNKEMVKYAYWVLVCWTVIFILLFVSGFITFGHGIGDIIYAFYVVVFFILISILRYKVLKGRMNLIIEYFFFGVIALFIGYITLEFTLLRGPEYAWNGRFFYHDATN
ncbi:esterase/lipase family protein [Chitinophaga filiformis]|uniref:RHS repeat-associated core domain-containing protein n=1 Tax=Chitinophaga filiformis TaxID=104663 RepID=A0A1G8CDJ3_CHIFI|nr:RHS repeat-associated core domain-containing protein [Chitinophaga filiformis]SDH43243.1 RHS repeat-associated core domain-containing protein [Chitinophaga filiformis]